VCSPGQIKTRLANTVENKISRERGESDQNERYPRTLKQEV
jgi:hypothetical protein